MDKDPLSFITSPPDYRGVPDVTQADIDKKAAAETAKQNEEIGPEPLLDQDKMAEPMGLNIDMYLAGDLPPEQRISRLETVAITLYKELQALKEQQETIRPMPVDTAPYAADMKKTMSSDTVSAPPLDITGMKKDTVEKGPRSLDTTQTSVTGIRVGQHPGYIRIVFDVTGKTPFKVDLDNTENILVVELNGTAWQPPVMSESFGKMPLLRSYKVDQMGGGAGHIFIMQLKGPTTVTQQKMYPALSGGGQRIVVDLKL